MTKTLWKIGNAYYRMECDLNLHKVAEVTGLELTPRRLRKVVERIPAGTGIYQKYKAKYPIPKQYRQQWEDETFQERAERDAQLDGYIGQVANLVKREHGVIVPTSHETPYWMSKEAHAGFLNHFREILDNAKGLGVTNFAAHRHRNIDHESPDWGKLTLLSNPQPLTVSFKWHRNPETMKASAVYDSDTHTIHIHNPNLASGEKLESFKDYENSQLEANNRVTIKKNQAKVMPRKRGWLSLPEATFAHELGHALHHKYEVATRPSMDESQYWRKFTTDDKPTQRHIRRILSQYVASDPSELVAETTAKLLHHYPVSADVMDLYHQFGGHPLRTDRIPEPAWRF
ncbi:hypothetical protein [Synechococcus sp. PCC 6312]|uniref:hypothetical protein n=1 Tax=Synechococcus sp. (strain ATCC 27167 / PCC 6312) TaxID=195253 RepID=UPI00029F1842|nr:hypothetical protein [Synechococcus sp. PCC 6312]AFY60086.1 hypothetical protein Syn6312_0878 [Synechococcus sp. PCC 6312]